jgi:drug/metabolite transporter (DMT)-like permease
VAPFSGEPLALDWTPRAVAAFLFLTLASSCLAYSAYAWLTVHASPVMVGSYGYVCPAVAALLGWLVLDEILSGLQVCGMAVILVGIALVTGYWQPIPRARSGGPASG